MVWLVYEESTLDVLRLDKSASMPQGVPTLTVPDGTTLPPSPGPKYRLRLVNGAAAWVDTSTLDDIKAAKRAEINAAREAADSAPLSTQYGSFDADLGRRMRLTLAIQALATATTRTQVTFTLADNSRSQLSPAQITAVGVLLFDRDDANAATAAARRAAIDAATTVAAVQAITWA